MQQHELKPQHKSRKKSKRIGRGVGSGHGAFSTNGVKGQHARTGKKVHWWFEGGQTPLHRRMPKMRGFASKTPSGIQAVNLGDLTAFTAGSTIDRQSLHAKHLIRSASLPVKLLGTGDAPQKLTIRVEAISAIARQKLEAAGGVFESTAKAKA